MNDFELGISAFFDSADKEERGEKVSSLSESEQQALMDSASDELGMRQSKASAMAIAIQFVESGDSTFDAIDALVQGIADIDEDGEISEEEEDDYNELLSAVADALVELGADPEKVKDFIDDEDDGEGQEVWGSLRTLMDSEALDDNELIARHALPDAYMLDAVQKVVRNGKVKLIKKPLRKRRMTAKQRAALKKAQRKANTGNAKRARAKAMKMRKSRGI